MTRWTVLYCLALAILGCGNGSPRCIAGASTACTGPAGCAGGQVCNVDGTYGVCNCGAADASMPDASTTDAGRDATDATLTDASEDAGPPGPCNPVTQTGCATGQRCTWVATSDVAGHVACLADGTVARLGACTRGPVGEATGFDDCRAGLLCASGVCAPICDIDAPNPTGYACGRFSGVFVDAAGMPTTTGVGVPTCNPMTQVRESDGAAACGSPNPSAPTLGCYGTPGGEFSCAPAGNASLTSDMPAAVSSSGSPYLNGCAPGFLPLLRRSTSDGTPICVALCQPGPTSVGSGANAGGVAPHTCASRGAGGTHECRYWFALETAPFDRWANTLGYCVDYTQYQIGTPPMTDPSCTSLSATAGLDWGCVPHP